ncbi:MAG TPA: DNA translocase FtsK 4TM domain-containing protein [Elusimicrobiota bacterium]|nr:DNA translocase FtsK 4TM domain-containing protein [Elusimicrobiota bacterium]
MVNAYFKSRVKTQGTFRRKKEMAGILLLILGVVSFYCVLFPAGSLGRLIKGGLAWTFGSARVVIPVLVSYVGVRLAITRPWPQSFLRISLWGALIFFYCTLASLFGQAAFHQNYGGALGLAGSTFFSRLLGIVGAWIVSVSALLLGTCGLFKVSPVEVIEHLIERLRADLDEWKGARKESSAKKPPVVKPRPLTVSAKTGTAEPAVPPPPPAIIKPLSSVTDEKGSEDSSKPARKPVAKKPAETALETAAVPAPPSAPYELPPADLLREPSKQGGAQVSDQDLEQKAKLLEQTLANFGVSAHVTAIHPGPVITRYDLEPAPGVKVSSIVNRADDVALAMKASRVRVLAPIPGKGAVGIEIPNTVAAMVTLKEIMQHPNFQNTTSFLTVALGKTSSGEPYIADLAPMPHLLVAGATGAGKSVCIHTLIMSILYRTPPDRVKFLLIDPKRLELPIYDGMPHLYDPRVGPEEARVITQPKEAAKALSQLVKVMEYRYEVFAKANVRNIDGYNEKRAAAGLPPEYYIVVIIDELADLMLVATREVEDTIQRLAQMARAVGIHLVLATQRPSVDVITGVIKANLPARIALRVASQTDSRVIIDTSGAETLVGSGDMLFLPAGAPAPIRLQGAYVSEKEVDAVVSFAKKQSKPFYENIFKVISQAEEAEENAETLAELVQALELVLERRRVSQDLLKAHFGSSARATNVLSLLEVRGFIHKPEGTNRWEIFYDKIEEYLEHAKAGRSSN